MHPVIHKFLAFAASLWAISFHGGEHVSTPPQWMSNVSPRYFVLMALHSMCQLVCLAQFGFPVDAPSSGVHAFQSAKSWASSLAYSSWLTLTPTLSSSTFMCDNFP